LSDVFKDKSASILLADPLSGVRPIMSAALRELGFNRVMSVDSVTEALNILAAEPVDWLITSLFPDGKVNGLQVLKLARQERRLQNLKVTFFLSEEERFVLSKAFALGLFTWHAKPFNKDQFSAEMAGVVKQLEANRWNRTLTSAEYLRPSLKSRSDHVALVQLEQALYQAFPEDLRLLLRLAEAHFLAGDSLRARTLLWQAEQRDSELTTEARAISDAFIGKALGAKDTNEWKALDLGVCVVVDPDETAQTGIKETLGTCGAKAVMTFANGGAAWEWLRGQPEPDVIVMEWRIPGVSGPALLQRIRSHGFHQVSVVVHSSLVHKKDAQLLKEMGVSEIVEKPFRRGDFLNCLAWTVGQAHRPTEGRMLEAKIRALLAGGDFASATNFMQLYVTKNDPQDPGRKQLEAEFAFASGDFASARDLASASVRLGNKSVTALNLLGKALMRLRDFKAALRIFEKANGISPNSVSRLCAIAETQQELGDGAAARRTLGAVPAVRECSRLYQQSGHCSCQGAGI
jgi:CheY-like chemotaxis protein